MVHKLGYGNWDELKAAFRTAPLFRFDWFVKSRTTQELARRCDTLIRLVERENQEFDERERQARKEKKLAKVYLGVLCAVCSVKRYLVLKVFCIDRTQHHQSALWQDKQPKALPPQRNGSSHQWMIL